MLWRRCFSFPVSGGVGLGLDIRIGLVRIGLIIFFKEGEGEASLYIFFIYSRGAVRGRANAEQRVFPHCYCIALHYCIHAN